MTPQDRKALRERAKAFGKRVKHTPGPWAYAEGRADRREASTVHKARDPEFLIAQVNCEWANQRQRAEEAIELLTAAVERAEGR